MKPESIGEAAAATPLRDGVLPMDKDKFIRRVLWASVVFNFAGALLFAFPASTAGQLAGLPLPGPRIYTTLLAYFVALFGCAYAWLACQPNIDRPLVAFSAIGKAGAFAVIFYSWVVGAIAARCVVAAMGDLIFAALFILWLVAARRVC